MRMLNRAIAVDEVSSVMARQLKNSRQTAEMRISWMPAMWLLIIGLFAMQGALAGHQLTHENLFADRCAVCHVSGSAVAPEQAAAYIFAADFHVVPAWALQDYIPIASEQPTYRTFPAATMSSSARNVSSIVVRGSWIWS